MIRSLGTFYSNLPGADLFSHHLTPPADIPEFIPRPFQTQFLHPWSAEQAAKFGLVRRTPNKEQTKRPDPNNRLEIDPEDLNDLFG